jgi:uncharacterized membrane protein YgdD (TMEM256/DUF423 family)
MGFAALGAGLLSLSVALGALGRHQSLFADAKAAELFDIALRYHATHALGLIGAAWLVERAGRARPALWGARLIAAGVCVFAGTLYAQAFGLDTPLSRLRPLGGTLLISGWAATAFGAAQVALKNDTT